LSRGARTSLLTPSRRDVCRAAGAVCAAAALGLGCGGAAEGDDDDDGLTDQQDQLPAPDADGVLRVTLADYPALAAVGGSVRDAPPGVGHAVILLRHASGDTAESFAALDAECTHQYCGVIWSQADTRQHSPCHGSQFGLDGAVVHGPATVPLSAYAVSLEAGVLSIDLAGT
jgi:Rieske Fe-S protein